mmetsp:Transcript_8208/g.21158  ORF Transcript_8208/g.21158 Transcript_8208/m.21158 type:complete len:94 (+) Transcript_8208:523-804(+)
MDDSSEENVLLVLLSEESEEEECGTSDDAEAEGDTALVRVLLQRVVKPQACEMEYKDDLLRPYSSSCPSSCGDKETAPLDMAIMDDTATDPPP